MAKSLSFKDILAATARQKLEAAKSRSTTNPAAEKPKDVILAACAAIGDDLKDDGFIFLKSGPKLKRTAGDFTYEIFFQSDRNNIAGRRAAVWIHAGVSSDSLAIWRRNHPSPWVRRKGLGAGTVIGGQIGNLLSEPSWMEWDFADQSKRDSEIEDAVSVIRRIIFPFFALFDDPPSAVDILMQRGAFSEMSLLEYALMELGPLAAEKAGRSFLTTNPQISERHETAFRKFAREGLPAYRSDTGSDFAALAVATGLDFTPED